MELEAGRDPPDLTRQICNAWKSDRTSPASCCEPTSGGPAPGWAAGPARRLSQDNVLWKPPGGKALGFHQDSSYEQWAVPPDWVSCWIALEDTTAAGGTVEYVADRTGGPALGNDRAVPRAPTTLTRATAGGEPPAWNPSSSPSRCRPEGERSTPVDMARSGVNRSALPRRSLVAHCMSSEARFDPDTMGYLYSRYKRFGDDTMDETFFPSRGARRLPLTVPRRLRSRAGRLGRSRRRPVLGQRGRTRPKPVS